MIKRVLISPEIILGNKTNAKQNSKWQHRYLPFVESIGISGKPTLSQSATIKTIAPPHRPIHKPNAANNQISPRGRGS